MMPLFWIAAAFIVGIILGKTLPLPLWVWAGATLLMLGLFWISHKRSWLSRFRNFLRVSPFLLLVFIVLGGLRFSLSLPHWNQHDLAWYNERGTYTLVAVVDRPPDVREDAVYLHLAAREVYDPSTMTFTRIRGAALARFSTDAHWQLGDVLRMDAAPLTPSTGEDFSYRDYLEHQGIYTVIYHPSSVHQVGSGQAGRLAQWLEPLRILAARTLYQIYPQPESGLLEGILLGNDNNLPATTAEAYQNTGTAHIIAISGFNIAILAALFFALFTKMLNRYWSMVFTGILLALYAFFVGSSPSVIRAAIMAVMALSGRLIGRKGNGVNALGLSAGIMCLFQPQLPWDVSFQLSFAATLGLVLFADPMQGQLVATLNRHFSEETANRLSGPLSEFVLFTLAAQITTLPVILFQFKRISFSSLIANPLVLPFQPFVMIGGMIATILGMAWLPIGRFAAILTWPVVAYTNWIVSILNHLRGGSMVLSHTLTIQITIILLLLFLLFLFRKVLVVWVKQLRWGILVALLGMVAVILWVSIARSPDGNLHLNLIRTGDQSALFLKSPSGTTLLFDPSNESNSLAASVSALLSPWNFSVDNVLVTNLAAAKNIAELNERLPIQQTYLAPPAYLLSAQDSPADLPQNLPVKKLKADEAIGLENGLVILPVASDLRHSAFLLQFGQVKIFIPGGTDPAAFSSARASILAGLSVLILNQTDLKNLPADMWQNYGAQTILWNDPSIAPDSSWEGLDSSASIEIRSDGKTISLHLLK